MAIFIDNDWGLFKKILLTHFTGSDTDDRSEVLVFVLSENELFGWRGNFGLIGKVGSEQFENGLVFEAFELEDFFL